MSLLRRIFYGRCRSHPDRWSIVSRWKQTLGGECAHCYGWRILAWERAAGSGDRVSVDFAFRIAHDGVTFPIGMDSTLIPAETRREFEAENGGREESWRDWRQMMDAWEARLRAEIEADRVQRAVDAEMLL